MKRTCKIYEFFPAQQAGGRETLKQQQMFWVVGLPMILKINYIEGIFL